MDTGHLMCTLDEPSFSAKYSRGSRKGPYCIFIMENSKLKIPVANDHACQMHNKIEIEEKKNKVFNSSIFTAKLIRLTNS